MASTVASNEPRAASIAASRLSPCECSSSGRFSDASSGLRLPWRRAPYVIRIAVTSPNTVRRPRARRRWCVRSTSSAPRTEGWTCSSDARRSRCPCRSRRWTSRPSAAMSDSHSLCVIRSDSVVVSRAINSVNFSSAAANGFSKVIACASMRWGPSRSGTYGFGRRIRTPSRPPLHLFTACNPLGSRQEVVVRKDPHPNEIDWVIVRENSEGEYGGRAHRGLPIEVGTETAVFTRAGVERIHRFAFELARKRPRKHLTLVTKSNAQRFGMVMWDEIFFEVARDFPDVKTDRELVDAVTTRM